MRHYDFPRATVLVLGSNSVQSLLPSTLISQADALLEYHRITDAVDLAEQQRRKLGASSVVNDHEADELRYVYQRLGFQCLSETLFDDAGKHLFAGELDPRVLVSYYPELRGSLFDADEALDVFAGVAEHMPPEDSIDEIIVANLVRNYSPHLPPSTREAPPTVELRKILNLTATDMLEVYLRKWRSKTQTVTSQKAEAIRRVTDTVLVKLYASYDDTTLLDSLVDEPNFVVISEVEPVLQKNARIATLCKLYLQRGEDNKLLDTWSKLVEGKWVDRSVQDPLTNMFVLLTESRDRALIQQWAVWLTKRDPIRALKLLTSSASGKRKADEDRVLLKDIQSANPSAGAQYLEFLVLQRRVLDPELHMQLASHCVDGLLSCLAEETTEKLWRAKETSYSSSNSDTSFLSYFASTTPDSEPKRTRLKAALFLQGSTLYDPETIRSRLAPHEKLLRLEAAILDGKLARHRAALTILVHELHDSTSAEAYCTLGGQVVPERTAQMLGERYGLQEWAALLVPSSGPGNKKVNATPMSRLNTVDTELKKELIKILLQVYMSGGESTAERTARFLNAQAMNLEVLDVISLIPPEWPLHILSTFLTRSFRRTLHMRHEGQIVKAISAGENLAVAERTWYILREQGALLEEAADDDSGDDQNAEGDEKGLPASFDEKVALRGAAVEDDRTDTATVEIDVEAEGKDGLERHDGVALGLET